MCTGPPMTGAACRRVCVQSTPAERLMQSTRAQRTPAPLRSRYLGQWDCKARCGCCSRELPANDDPENRPTNANSPTAHGAAPPGRAGGRRRAPPLRCAATRWLAPAHRPCIAAAARPSPGQAPARPPPAPWGPPPAAARVLGGGPAAEPAFYTLLSASESMASPMVLRPLSTYMTWPVTAEASGEHRKHATLPTCGAGRAGRVGSSAAGRRLAGGGACVGGSGRALLPRRQAAGGGGNRCVCRGCCARAAAPGWRRPVQQGPHLAGGQLLLHGRVGVGVPVGVVVCRC